MNPIAHTLMRAGNRAAVWLYQRTDGRVGGHARNLPVLLLTVRGRKTGTPRTVPVAYFEHDGGYVVAASGGGTKDDPQWIHNLRAAAKAEIRIGAQERTADVHVAEGEERERLWRDVVLARAPFFEKYRVKAGRTIPLAKLTPTSG